MLQWNVNETEEQNFLTHAVTPNKPFMKHKLLHFFLFNFCVNKTGEQKE